jgi:hypothetical protein
MNGPLSKEELPEDEASTADYTIGRNSIYCLFAWSKVEQARRGRGLVAEKREVESRAFKIEKWI